jgi:mono/diheme cytochrome c family protein
MPHRPVWIIAAALIVPPAALAEEASPGRIEYMLSCAQCHGTGARGDGVIAGYLTTPPPDLTTLARRNGGVFPADDIYAIIEGGKRTGPHGSREMPAWGIRYAVEAAEAYGFTYTPEEQAAYIHERIRALVGYIASLQAD